MSVKLAALKVQIRFKVGRSVVKSGHHAGLISRRSSVQIRPLLFAWLIFDRRKTMVTLIYKGIVIFVALAIIIITLCTKSKPLLLTKTKIEVGQTWLLTSRSPFRKKSIVVITHIMGGYVKYTMGSGYYDDLEITRFRRVYRRVFGWGIICPRCHRTTRWSVVLDLPTDKSECAGCKQECDVEPIFESLDKKDN